MGINGIEWHLGEYAFVVLCGSTVIGSLLLFVRRILVDRWKLEDMKLLGETRNYALGTLFVGVKAGLDTSSKLIE